MMTISSGPISLLNTHPNSTEKYKVQSTHVDPDVYSAEVPESQLTWEGTHMVYSYYSMKQSHNISSCTIVYKHV
jgi:hypothetical protein